METHNHRAHQDTLEAVLSTLLDPHADFLEAADQLGLPLTEFLSLAESPPIIQAIEALERLAELRARALLARSAHTAIAALERIAAGEPQTPGATETARKASAQLLRMAAKASATRPPEEAEHTPAQSTQRGPGNSIEPAACDVGMEAGSTVAGRTTSQASQPSATDTGAADPSATDPSAAGGLPAREVSPASSGDRATPGRAEHPSDRFSRHRPPRGVQPA
ncbi:MAG: hypothetical protein IPJ41_05695 [Phycisphaerales bacterium]|nr:hypothetical protein [Phycisphaerales bacterium]